MSAGSIEFPVEPKAKRQHETTHDVNWYEPEFPLRAIQDIVIVEQLEEEFTQGGIFLPGDHKKFPCGRVVAVGPGRTYSFFMDANGNTQAGQTVPVTLKVGDWVLFGRYNSGGEPIEIDGRKFLMCREGDIAAASVTGDPVKVRLGVAD
jgi:co-chaperonin GroES (HSP10)